MQLLAFIPAIAAALAAVLIGYVWYHPRLFGSRWLTHIGMSSAQVQQVAAHRHRNEALSFIAAFVLALALQELMRLTVVENVEAAIEVAILAWFGLAVPLLLDSMLWEGRESSVLMIDAGYWLVAFILMGVILAL